MIDIGKLNVLEVCIGARGTGKSTLQCERAYDQLAESGGGYLIGHSIGARLPTELPDGTPLDIEYHRTVEKLAKGVSASPGVWHILSRGAADDVIRFSMELSRSVRRSAWKRERPFESWNDEKVMRGIKAPPIAVVIDEGIAIHSAASGSKRDDDQWFFEYLYSLRHNHIALYYSIQESTSRSWKIVEQATDIHVFSLRHEWALNAVRAAGATREEMERIGRLPTPKQLANGTRKHDYVSLALGNEDTE